LGVDADQHGVDAAVVVGDLFDQPFDIVGIDGDGPFGIRFGRQARIAIEVVEDAA
jgi:hypothetical protein